ncbi:SLBB domain-containing protein [Rhodohalobacter sulfatireducens]|uniref:SLBB domain-containing protein n=1 Tax=Rhodohalobacter sulfatireducens TaxID=2911366 RepID=A0ABS9KJD6_9BACT|nr:SLBB domain-containing protein [Rhodohalobacter sulfatireducens]MCG2590965.1 SLBB domain-containing protein [Rhodohalobacter sulfatireducens]
MKKVFSLFLLILISSLFFLPQHSTAQVANFGMGNIQNVNVNNLTDDQLRNFYQQMQAQGLTAEQVGSIARARGMPANQASQLVTRLNQLSSTQATGGETTTSGTQTRQGQGSAELLYPQRSLQEQSLLLSELQRLVEERNEEDLMDQLELIIEEGFPVFGEAMFTGASQTFEPSLNIPTPVDYVFGSGDQIEIEVWGAAEAEYVLEVTPSGNINIPNIGPINIGGMVYPEARTKILRNLQQIYSGINLTNPSQGNTFADVTLGDVRSINVSVIGEVRQPGSYTISSLATIFNLLYAAGGPNRSGSWREIQVIRGDSIAHTFDMYDLLVYGNQKDNIRLRDQDVIKIPPYINRIELTGEVKRPGLFELKDGETLADLMTYSGGFSANAYKDRIVVDRKTSIQRSVSDVNWPEGGDFVLQNGDEIEIGTIVDRYTNRVTIEGAVYKPGEYELTDGLTLSELIQKSQGVTEDAYLERGIIYRNMDNLMLESIPFSVRDILQGNSEDIRLRRNDMIRISSRFDLRETLTISVRGAVNSPETFEYLEGMTLQDAIFIADGLRDEAAAYRVEVARRVADDDTRVKVNQIANVYEFEIDEDFEFSGNAGEFELEPYDMVFVRTKPNYQEQLTVRIEGEVQYPGEYVLERRDAKLTDLVRQAGGLSDFAYPEGASMDRILEITAEQVQVSSGSEQRTDALSALNLENVDLDRFETVNDTTYTPVGIRLGDALDTPSGINDIRLQEGDIIRIPRNLNTVRVEGGVLSPVTMRYVPGRGLQDYIDNAGGTTDRGQRHRAYIVYANGEVDRVRRFLYIKNNPNVSPGATVIVPEKPQARELTPQERISLASSIASTALLFVTLLDRIQNN